MGPRIDLIMLHTMPCEVMIEIAEWLSYADLRSLSQVCSKLYHDLLPQSYRRINFHARNEWALNALNTDSYFRIHKQSQDNFHLTFIRDLVFSAPFEIARFNRCVYHDPYPTRVWFRRCHTLGPSNEKKAHAGFLDDVSRQVNQVVRRLADDKLRSFSWHLGVCIPTGLLDADSFLITHQRHLENLSLITDGSCPYAGHAINNLPQLTYLKSLAWEGIHHPLELKSLVRCVRKNQRLARLSIGFALTVTEFDVINTLFRVDTTASQPDLNSETRLLSHFPHLTHLSLSKAQLPRRPDLQIARRLTMLRSLSLLNCRNDLSLLSSLCHVADEIKIQSFEFCCNMLEQESLDLETHSLTHFLQSFTGLTHLKLKLSSLKVEPDLVTAIAHHRSSLQSLIYHERELQLVDDEGRFQELRDKELTWMMQLPHMVNSVHLSALALCVPPSQLRLMLEPLRKETSLHTLHLRWSGSEKVHRNIREEMICRLISSSSCSPDLQLKPIKAELGGDESHHMARTTVVSKRSPEEDEYVAFVQWAFGPQGMPTLETLALGDFSFGDRYRNQQLLLRRKTKENKGIQFQETQLGFGLLDRDFFVGTSDNVSLHDNLTVEDLNFLRACPDGSLMESPYE